MDARLEAEYLERWLKGDVDAILLVNDLASISQAWDDLIDNDGALGPDEINGMMMAAMMLPRNPFYARHIADLLPVMEERMFAWMDANVLEASGEVEQLRISYIMRSVVTDIVVYIAGLVGGVGWRNQIAQEIRSVIYADNESFEDYCDEHSRNEVN